MLSVRKVCFLFGRHVSAAAEAAIVSDSEAGTGPGSSTAVGTESMTAPGRQEPVESRAESEFWEPGRFHAHGIRARRVQIMPGPHPPGIGCFMR